MTRERKVQSRIRECIIEGETGSVKKDELQYAEVK